MALIPPFFLDCVVAIGFEASDGTRHYAATGFLFGRLFYQEGEKKRYHIFLVTNKHVVQGRKKAWLRFDTEDGESARELEMPLATEEGKCHWLDHPDSNIDLALVPLNAPFLQTQGVRFGFFRSDQHVITRDKAVELGVSEGDAIFVLGYPMGIVGEKGNFVIVRQGTIARIRDTLRRNSNSFLVDTTVFPGNSGGPVVTKPEFVYIHGTKAINHASLIGIVASYVPYQDVAISAQTNRQRIIFEENSGLAAVIPIDFVLEILEARTFVMNEEMKASPLETTQVTPQEPFPLANTEMEEE